MANLLLGVAKGAGAVVVAYVALSMVTTAALRGVAGVLESRQRTRAPPCHACAGRRLVPCQLCKGRAALFWSPLAAPAAPRPCVCPTCDGKRVQRCLNCVGRGYEI